MTKIDSQALDEVRRHAEDEYPDECCGMILALADASSRVIRLRNIQNEMHAKDPALYPRTARTAYAGHPTDLREALEAAEQPGCALLAFYHSHPDHDAYFSAEDTAQATPFGEPSYPDAWQVVVAIHKHKAGKIKVFAWSPQASAYLETAMEEG